MTPELLDRLPPQSLDAEKAVLGCIILDPPKADAVAEVLRPEDFYAAAHGLLYRHLLAARDANRWIDVGLLVDRLKAAGDLEAVGGLSALAEIAHTQATSAAAVYHARIVRERADRRVLSHVAAELYRDAYDDHKTAETAREAAEAGLMRVGTGRGESKVLSLADHLAAWLRDVEAVRRREKSAGVLTGLWDIDHKIGGLFPKELTILAARPSVGKSALAMQIAYHVGSRGRRVFFASLEMGGDTLAGRLVCSEADVDGTVFRTGNATADDLARVTETINTVAAANVVIDDASRVTVSRIRRHARQQASHGLALVVVDYLQLVKSDDTDRQRKQRYEVVAEQCHDLKSLAKELAVPVLCLAQLGRQAVGEAPGLHHLRESGDIEQDADGVLLLYRHEPPPAKQVEALAAYKAKWGGVRENCRILLEVAKQRNGPKDFGVALEWIPERTRFRCMNEPGEWRP